MRNAKYVEDQNPLDSDCLCRACRQFSRAYVAHLVRSGEILGAMLLTCHNVTFYQDVMAELRTAIQRGDATAWAERFVARYKGSTP